jgi:hypothetical protein
VRFLAEESCDTAITRALRAAGHDVLVVSELRPGMSDAEVLAMADSQARVLITEDKDFGQLVRAAGRQRGGVILLRYPFPLAARLADERTTLITKNGDDIPHGFVVLQPGKARILRNI